MKNLNFKNPPILEAVLDISFENNEPGILELITKTNQKFESSFPNQKEIHKFEGKFNISSESPTSTSHTKTLVGFSCSNEEKQELIQRRINGFSFHKLKPYCGGDQFIESATRHWEGNLKILNINSPNTSKIGLRFINLINLRDKTIDQALDISISNIDIGKIKKIAYSYSLELENEYNSNVNLYPTNNNEYILDIDIFKDLENQKLDRQLIKEHFEFMRNQKNAIFNKTLNNLISQQYEPIES